MHNNVVRGHKTNSACWYLAYSSASASCRLPLIPASHSCFTQRQSHQQTVNLQLTCDVRSAACSCQTAFILHREQERTGPPGRAGSFDGRQNPSLPPAPGLSTDFVCHASLATMPPANVELWWYLPRLYSCLPRTPWVRLRSQRAGCRCRTTPGLCGCWAAPHPRCRISRLR
jgi:hypothetical protein